MATLERVTTETMDANEWKLDGHTAVEWARFTMIESDTATLLAGRLADAEGLEHRSPEWAKRTVEIYHAAKDEIVGHGEELGHTR